MIGENHNIHDSHQYIYGLEQIFLLQDNESMKYNANPGISFSFEKFGLNALL